MFEEFLETAKPSMARMINTPLSVDMCTGMVSGNKQPDQEENRPREEGS